MLSLRNQREKYHITRIVAEYFDVLATKRNKSFSQKLASVGRVVAVL